MILDENLDGLQMRTESLSSCKGKAESPNGIGGIKMDALGSGDFLLLAVGVCVVNFYPHCCGLISIPLQGKLQGCCSVVRGQLGRKGGNCDVGLLVANDNWNGDANVHIYLRRCMLHCWLSVFCQRRIVG